MKTIMAILIALSGGLALQQPAVARGAGSCAPDDEYMKGFVSFVRHVVSSPTAESQATRAGLHLHQLKPDEVVMVRSDSLCARAGVLLNRERGRPESASVKVYMVSVGRQYWAEDSSKAGEWQKGVLTDSSVTRILSRPGR